MELSAGNVKLRPLRVTDALRLSQLADNKKISVNLRDGFPNPYSYADAVAFLERFSQQEPVTFFGIDYCGEYVGNISLMPGDDVYRMSAEIGYFIGEPYWNKGIITQAINLITDYGFTVFSFARIHAGVFEYNTVSMHVLEKCGFKREAILEKSIFKQEKLWSEMRYVKFNPALTL